MSSDKQTAINGGLWTGASTAVTMLSQILRIVILTRFLEKSDFGVVSIINMVLGLCYAFADLGFSSVIMYKQQMTEKEFSSLYWIQFVIYCVLYGLMFLFTPLIANFYNEEQLFSLIPFASLSLLFLAFGKLHETILQKKYQFKLLAIRNIITNIMSLFLAWLLAWKGFGILSLIISTLAQNVLYNAWSLFAGLRYQKLSFSIDINGVIPLVKMGLYQTYTRIADFLSSQLDVMIMGKLLGTEVLGVYDLAKQLIVRLSSFIRTVVSQVALPILSNNNNNDSAVVSRFLIVTKFVAFICVPICLVTAVLSKDIVLVMYGVSFLDAAPIVAIFSITTAISSVTSFFDILGITKGRTDLNFKNTVCRIILTTPIVFLTCLVNIEAVAWGQLLVTIVLTVVMWRVIVSPTYSMTATSFLSQFKMLIVSMVPSGIICYILFNNVLYNSIDNAILRVSIEVLVLLAVSVALSMTLLRKDIKYFYNLIIRK